MPKTSPNAPGSQTEKPNATIGDAINYATSDPSGIQYIVLAAKWIAGFVMALLKPAVKKP